jgi:hypothetical protein
MAASGCPFCAPDEQCGVCVGALRSDITAAIMEGMSYPNAILTRHRGVIEIRNAQEHVKLIESGAHHMEGWDDRFAYRAAVGRIVRRLRDAL